MRCLDGYVVAALAVIPVKTEYLSHLAASRHSVSVTPAGVGYTLQDLEDSVGVDHRLVMDTVPKFPYPDRWLTVFRNLRSPLPAS